MFKNIGTTCSTTRAIKLPWVISGQKLQTEIVRAHVLPVLSVCSVIKNYVPTEADLIPCLVYLSKSKFLKIPSQGWRQLFSFKVSFLV